jgi:hypothetical protein
MTPKDKAKQLVDRFYSERSRDDLPLTIYWTSAIGCALIAIDEIIRLLQDLGYDNEDYRISYELEVKKEIESL